MTACRFISSLFFFQNKRCKPKVKHHGEIVRVECLIRYQAILICFFFKKLEVLIFAMSYMNHNAVLTIWLTEMAPNIRKQKHIRL